MSYFLKMPLTEITRSSVFFFLSCGYYARRRILGFDEDLRKSSISMDYSQMACNTHDYYGLSQPIILYLARINTEKG